MFCKVGCVWALLVICLFKFNSSSGIGVNFLKTIQTDKYLQCEDLSNFRVTLHSLPPNEAIEFILLPLSVNDSPLEIQNLRLRIISLVSHGIINLNDLLQIIETSGLRNRFDYTIALLFAIGEYGNISSYDKETILNAALYLLKKRYLNIGFSQTSRPSLNNVPGLRSAGPVGPLPWPSYGSVMYPNKIPGRNFNPNYLNNDQCQPTLFELLSNLIAMKNPFDCAPNYNPDVSVWGVNPPGGYIKPPIRPITGNRNNNPNFPMWGINTGKYLRPPGRLFTPPGSVGIVPNTPIKSWSSSYMPNSPIKPWSSTYMPNSPIKPWSSSYMPNSPIKSWSSSFMPPNAPTMPVIPPSTLHETVYSNLRHFDKPYDASHLINIIPTPIYPIEIYMHNKLKDLLASSYVQDLIKTLDLTPYSTDEERLYAILTHILSNNPSDDIRKVSNFFLTFKEANKIHFNYGALLEVLPQPESPKEQQFYNIIEQLLLSPWIYELAISSNFATAQDLSQKLLILLQELANNPSLSFERREAINYYLAVINGIKANVNYGNLIYLLPSPANDAENEYYLQLKNFLESHDVYLLLHNLNQSNLTDQERLMLILYYLINNSSFSYLSDAALKYRNLLAENKYKVNYFDLIGQIPRTTDANNYIDVLLNYFYTREFEDILSHVHFEGISDANRLLSILQAIISSSKNTSVVEAANFLIAKQKISAFNELMLNVIGLIPLPNTEEEKQKYEIVRSFLLSEQVYNLIGRVDLTVFPDSKSLLNFVLKTIADSNVGILIKDAAEYYIDLTERLLNIEFITRKEIKKRFNLTQIFIDVLDLKSLNLAQKAAFKKFFKYIAEIKPDALSGFSSWDQAQTRGQFIKLLFHYLLEQESTAEDIKECIRELNGLVHLDGRGSNPP